MKLFIFTAIGGALLLSGCAGTSSEFECNATTSDTCMTMHQANDKAKLKEEGDDTVKPVAGALPRLADGNFSSASNNTPATSMSLPTPSVQRVANAPFTAKPVLVVPQPASVKPSSQPYITPVTTPVVSIEYPRPLRVGERTAQLWIAPYIDTADVYHQPSNVVFVVTSSHWGKPRIR